MPASPVVEGTVGPDVPEDLTSQRSPILDELAAIARRIRKAETMEKQPAYNGGPVDAAQDDEGSGLSPGLTDIAEASHNKDTAKALSDVLGLGKKAETSKPEE